MIEVIEKPFSHNVMIDEYNNVLNAYKRTLSNDDVRDIVEICLRFADLSITRPHLAEDFSVTINEIFTLDIFLGVTIPNVERLYSVTDKFISELVVILIHRNFNNPTFVVSNVFAEFYMVETLNKIV